MKPHTKRTGDSHAWIGTETVKTRFGDFRFQNNYPTGNSAQRLRDMLAFNRAVEAYLVQMPGVSWYRVWRGVAEAGTGAANQVVIWETLMDSQTLLLTGNTETVYGLCSMDLKRDGPVVIQAPAMMLGGITDIWQRQVMDIGPTGVDKGTCRAALKSRIASLYFSMLFRDLTTMSQHSNHGLVYLNSGQCYA
jgi:hypothetical protein